MNFMVMELYNFPTPKVVVIYLQSLKQRPSRVKNAADYIFADTKMIVGR